MESLQSIQYLSSGSLPKKKKNFFQTSDLGENRKVDQGVIILREDCLFRKKYVVPRGPGMGGGTRGTAPHGDQEGRHPVGSGKELRWER